MLHTVLVPLDGSPVAEQGLTSARRLAKETGATLSLVRGVLYLASDSKAKEADRMAMREARDYLRGVQNDLTREGFAVRTAVVPCDPVNAILFAADMEDADLISICTHGTSGLRHALMGSVAEAVLRRSDTPILITHARPTLAGQPATPYRRLLVPLDGTSFAEAALSYLAKEQIGSEAELILMQVVAPVAPPYVPGLMGDAAAQLYKEADQATQTRLLDAEAYLCARGTDCHRTGAWHARATLGAAAEAILAAATSENVDMIVLVTHGRHGFERLMHGSVAQELLRHSDVPVLILPSDAAHAATPEEHRAVTGIAG